MLSWTCPLCTCLFNPAEHELPVYVEMPKVKDEPMKEKVNRSLESIDEIQAALQVLVKEEYTFLTVPTHHLYRLVREVEETIKAGDAVRAKRQLQRIELACEQEEASLSAAFKMFLLPGHDFMNEKELKTMLKYLGFPHKDEDVDKLISTVDVDGDREVALPEFQRYVGRMGGSAVLFNTRRKTLKSFDTSVKNKLMGVKTELDAEELAEMRMDLLSAGITEQAQAYWRVVLPDSEFREMTGLVPCQREAIRHIRALAKSNHEAALPKLQQRYRNLGYEDSDLWMTLAYIREVAPIVIHMNLDTMLPFLDKDTHYRNQFETASSGGLLNTSVREAWEHDLFGGAYDTAKKMDRIKYGVLNTMNDYRGVVKCAQYGDSYLVLKDVRLRCTFSPEDSANLKAKQLAVLDHYAHVLDEYSDAELRETFKVASSTEAALLGDSTKVGSMKYKEAQIHGPVSFKDNVERLVAHERHRGMLFGMGSSLKKICEKHDIVFTWRDEEKKRLEEEVKHKIGKEQFEKRLSQLESKEVPDASNVPEGLCRKGCGRECALGTDAKGRKFTTCCRGCALGFGHDDSCGSGDIRHGGNSSHSLANNNVGAMCKSGCGKPVNPGRTTTGRRFTTCCRSCAITPGTHDPWCGDAEEQGRRSQRFKDGNFSNATNDPSMCKKGCGRRIATWADSKTGYTFETCCKRCAIGKGHTKNCEKRQKESMTSVKSAK